MPRFTELTISVPAEAIADVEVASGSGSGEATVLGLESSASEETVWLNVEHIEYCKACDFEHGGQTVSGMTIRTTSGEVMNAFGSVDEFKKKINESI